MKRRSFAVLLVCAQLAWPAAAFAAPVSEMEWRFSRQSISTATNLELRFVTADAVSSGAHTITLTFPAGFSLTAITASDVGISHRVSAAAETVETVAASAAGGVWGAAVSGQTITLTPPTNAAVGEIAAGEEVIIRIGQNVTGGSGQIVVPSAVGTYTVSLAGGFLGFGAAQTPIIALSDSRFTIGFTVPSSGGGASAASGGGGGGGVGAGGGAAAGGAGAAAGAGGTGPDGTAAGGATTPDGTGTTPGTDADGTGATSGGAASDATSPAGGTSSAGTDADGTGATSGGAAAAGSSGGGGAAASGGSGGGAAASSGASSGGSAGSGGAGSAGGGGAGGGGAVGSGGGSAASTTTNAPTTIEGQASGTVPVIPTAPPVGASPTATEALVPIVSPPAVQTPAQKAATYQWFHDELSLGVSIQAVPRILVGDEIRLRIENLDRAWSGWVEVGSSRFALTDAEGFRQAVVRVGSQTGTQTGELHLFNGVDPERVLPFSFQVVAPLRVSLAKLEGETIADTTVLLSRREGRSWKEIAKTALGESGVYANYAQAGTYRLEVRKKDWRTLRQDIVLTQAGPFTGEMIIEKDLQNPLAAIQKDAGIGENAALVAQATVDAVDQLIDRARTPETVAVAEVAAPAAIVASVSAVTAAASSFNIFAYLRFLITQPALLFRRRRREKWGLVYNAITKQPIDLAIVRLIDAQTKAVKQTRITDAQGRFAFLAEAGSYVFQVVKPAFVFPSVVLAKTTVDVDLVDLYHGEPVKVEGSATLTPNIPLDPVEKTETPKAIVRKRYWRKAQSALSVGSLGLTGAALIIQPTTVMWIFAVVQVGVFFLFRRLAIPPKPKNWGIVYDATTRKPISRAIVRIFDKKYNKLLETQLTDTRGKYAFFTGRNVYYVTAEAQGYERFVTPELDLRKEAMSVVHEPLALKQQSKPAA